MTQGGDEGKWWPREMVTKRCGDEGKWWRWTKGSGDEGKWWLRECGDFGKWWRREVVTKEMWWRWEVVTKGRGKEGKWWRWEVVTFASSGCRRRWKYLVCVAGAAAVVPDAIGSFYVFGNECSSCVRSFMRFLKLWLQIALEWLHECCMGHVLGRKPEHETLHFSV